MNRPCARASLVGIVLTLAACAAPPPVRSDAYRPIVDASQRMQLKGFSIMPPAGDHWYSYEDPVLRILTSNFKDLRDGTPMVSFQKRDRAFEQRRASDRNAQPFAVNVIAMYIKSPQATAKDLERETERLLRAAIIGGELTSLKMTAYSKQGTGCVRYESAIQWPPTAFSFQPSKSYMTGFVCRHPTVTDLIIHGHLLETRRGDQAGSPRSTRSEAEASLESVQFTPARP